MWIFSFCKLSYSFLFCLLLGLCIELYSDEKCFEKNYEWDESDPFVPRGQVSSVNFKSRILNNKRPLWIYTPSSYERRKKYPIVLVFDGQAYTSELIPGPIILDNLIAEGKIPPIVAVFISSLDQTTRNSELPCNERFLNFLNEELMPWISRYYSITSDPDQTIVAGSSYGGLAAAYAALNYPQRFGNVLSQSGAFWWNPREKSSEPWLLKQFEMKPLARVCFYLDVGNKETYSSKNQRSMIEVNRLLRKILEQKGYIVRYYEFNGGHEYQCWRKTFAIGLMALLGNKEP